jgi:FlaA1/EpsC-like NDP-sugar epimerase
MLPVGLVDDDPDKHGLRIQSTRVLGAVADIPALVKEYRVRQVLVAIPTATGAQMRRIVEVCALAGVEVLTLPGVFELLAGRVEVQRFRPVKVEDLLAREPVQTDTSQIHLLLADKVVLVTGAGGSIGSEVCRQIARCRPARLLLLGHGETSIYHIHQELSAALGDTVSIQPLIADTRDAGRIRQLFDRYRPEVVIHAAAHKHVPLMEANPEEAITTNVGGTKILVETCERFNVQTFVMISTDKAVNPTSMMGASKRIAEYLVQAAAHRTGRRFVAVRFGNVLGSRGSVIPLFQKQIEAGGPVTVTHPEMTRYFMTIPEAVQLVLQSAALGKGGEVFVLDMGQPVRIVDMARDMIRLAGLREGEDIDIAFTGLRPGEKLYEELFLNGEHTSRTLHEKVFVSRNGECKHDTMREASVDRLLIAARRGDTVALHSLIRELVPECIDTSGCDDPPEQAAAAAVLEEAQAALSGKTPVAP